MQALDTDGSGEIDRAELLAGLQKHLALNLSDAVVDVVFGELDADGDGTINSVEMVKKLSAMRGEPQVEESLDAITNMP